MLVIGMQKTYSKKKKKTNLSDYNDFYVQNDTLLLADVFDNFRNKCIECMNLILLIFYQNLNSMASMFKKDRSKV